MKTSTEITLTMVAIDPITRLHLREATTEETAAYWANNRPAPFDRPVRVGDVVIDTYTGPGGSHIPGRFLP